MIVEQLEEVLCDRTHGWYLEFIAEVLREFEAVVAKYHARGFRIVWRVADYVAIETPGGQQVVAFIDADRGLYISSPGRPKESVSCQNQGMATVSMRLIEAVRKERT